MIRIDAKGLTCPTPVILAKKSMQEGNKDITIIVDNDVARQNLQKLASSQGYESAINSESNGEFELRLWKVSDVDKSSTNSSYWVLIASDLLGSGAIELSSILMKGYLYALSESDDIPEGIAFMNSGVNLICQGSESVESVKKLWEMGVNIMACGTCLDYYGIKDSLLVGDISNMYSIVEALNSASKVIRV